MSGLARLLPLACSIGFVVACSRIVGCSIVIFDHVDAVFDEHSPPPLLLTDGVLVSILRERGVGAKSHVTLETHFLKIPAFIGGGGAAFDVSAERPFVFAAKPNALLVVAAEAPNAVNSEPLLFGAVVDGVAAVLVKPAKLANNDFACKAERLASTRHCPTSHLRCLSTGVAHSTFRLFYDSF